MAIVEQQPGMNDKAVLRLAGAESRIILTFDSDYGTLIYRDGLAADAGVVYLRFIPDSPLEPGKQLERMLRQSALQLHGRFTVVSRTQIRQRPLP